MDEIIEKKLRALAEENGIDADELLRLTEDGLPDSLREAVEALMGDMATYVRALDGLDSE